MTKNRYRAADILPFSQATEWTIFSLDPVPVDTEDAGIDPFAAPAPVDGKPVVVESPKVAPPVKKIPPDQQFHGYRILGQTKVAVSADIRSVISSLDAAGRHWGGGVAGCFSPRHGVRVIADGVVHDLLICYECMSAFIFRADEDPVGAIFFGSVLKPAPSPEVLNGALVKAKSKMPPPPRH